MFYLLINNMVITLDCFYVFILPFALRECKSFKAKKHISKHDSSNNVLIICISAKLSFDK